MRLWGIGYSAILALLGMFHAPALLMPLLIFVIFLASPTRIILGQRKLLYDCLILVAGVLLAAEDVYLLFGEPPVAKIASVAIVTGFLLFASVAYASARLPKKLPSVLPAKRNFYTVFLAFLGFFVMVLKPSLVWFRMMPDIAVVILATTTLVLLAEGKIFNSLFLKRLNGEIKKFFTEAIGLFTNSRTVLLGVSGLLLLHFTISTASAITGRQLVSLTGTLLLCFLPLYMWYKTFRVRSSHEHIPNWKGWFTGVVLGLICVAFLNPVISFNSQASIDQALVLQEIAGYSYTPIFIAIVIFLLCTIIGIHDYMRRLLMVGPFVAALIFVGTYVYHQFASVFFYTLNVIITYPFFGIPIIVVTSIGSVLFLVTGYLSFLYEIWRE